MPSLSLFPVFSLLSQMSRVAPTQPLRTFIRTTGYKLRPPRPLPHVPVIRRAQDEVLGSGRAAPHQLAQVLWEERKGSVPTIVIGGFVPDATESLYLLRGVLLKHGSVYYFNYPPQGFSNELLRAQLDDLVMELALRHGQKPVIFSISFGSGVVLEWLKRTRAEARPLHLGGLIFVSPVACVEDLLVPGEVKPGTLLGRAIKPYIETTSQVSDAAVEKSRTIFLKMFEAGAQNKEALRAIMTRSELAGLRDAVVNTINGITSAGACERVQALREMSGPRAFSPQAILPLSEAPALVLYGEKESAIITEQSPTRAAFEQACAAFFPQGRFQVVSNERGSPVQHASLIFHCFNFLPPLTTFYRQLKTGKDRAAA